MSFIKTAGYKLGHFIKTRLMGDRLYTPTWYVSETCPGSGKLPQHPAVTVAPVDGNYRKVAVIMTKCPDCDRTICVRGKKITTHKRNPKSPDWRYEDRKTKLLTARRKAMNRN